MSYYFIIINYLDVWGEWGAWADCTVSCGNGVRTRSQECLVEGTTDVADQSECDGTAESESVSCNSCACGKFLII